MRYVLMWGGAAILVVGSALVAAQAPMVLVQSIELPGVEGRIDHLSVDLDQNRLFVAALGNNSVEVVALQRGTRERSLAGFHEPQGIQVVPERQAIAVANGQSGTLEIIDSGTLHVAKTVPLSADADNVRYERGSKRLYVGHGSGGLAVIDATDWRVLGTIPLSGHPEAFQLESAGPRAFVNVPDARRRSQTSYMPRTRWHSRRSPSDLRHFWPVTRTANAESKGQFVECVRGPVEKCRE